MTASWLWLGTGVSELLMYNVLTITLSDMIEYGFSSDQVLFDRSLQYFSLASLIATCLMTFLSTDFQRLLALLIGITMNTCGVIIMLLGFVLKWSLYVIIGCSLMGFATACCQCAHFGICGSNVKLSKVGAICQLQIGQAWAGVMVWLFGILISTLKETESSLINSIALHVGAAIYVIGVNCCFVVAVQEYAEETLMKGNVSLMFEESTNKRIPTTVILLIIHIFIAMTITFTVFPALAPTRWLMGGSDVWAIGAYNVGDLIGRSLYPHFPWGTGGIFWSVDLMRCIMGKLAGCIDYSVFVAFTWALNPSRVDFESKLTFLFLFGIMAGFSVTGALVKIPEKARKP